MWSLVQPEFGKKKKGAVRYCRRKRTDFSLFGRGEEGGKKSGQGENDVRKRRCRVL